MTARTRTRPRVAIVGAGPAGAFTAASLLRACGDAEIDLFERLPTPWGLLRGGVAPDHQEIKRLADTFERQTLKRGCRFLGNVEVGTDISHAELMSHYSAVIYATGAQTDKSLGIPGENLPGSWAATEFVDWYNGHTDFCDLEFDLSAKRAVVIGNGNVAADVTRILMRSAAELERTDIADHALEALRESSIEEVVVLGRRGPAHAAFTSAELRELVHLDGVELRIDGDVGLDPVSQVWLAQNGTFTARTNVALLREFAARPPRADAGRRIILRFLTSPAQIRGDDRVEAIDVKRNEIVRAEDGMLRAHTAGEGLETIDCGLVLRSVGYRAVPLPEVPFDERSFVLPNERGRVLGPEREPLPGVYAVGWIKRGPTGILGTNKRDAEETVSCVAEDLAAGALPEPANGARELIDALLDERRPDIVTGEGWRAIARHELEGGRRQRRPRVKIAARGELLEVASQVELGEDHGRSPTRADAGAPKPRSGSVSTGS
ncbi:FAD-dependent oxidoreductase [soil metagenome]